MQTLRGNLESRIQQTHMLAHSFYTRWQVGELTQGELQGYVKEYYPFEKEFSRFVSAVHSRCENKEARQWLLENLIHEEQGSENHPELWLRFAEGLGVSREEMENHFHSDETEHLLRTFRKFTQTDEIIGGLAALYAYERQQPDVARQKIEGLKRFYNMDSERALAFFRAHQEVDVYHAETEMNILEKLCTDATSREVALNAAAQTLDALYEFLTGVERRYRQAA